LAVIWEIVGEGAHRLRELGCVPSCGGSLDAIRLDIGHQLPHGILV
jgi:hypothetical protein